jgi:hypothetical protein
MAKAKLPADTNKRAKAIVDIATGESEKAGLLAGKQELNR